MKHVILVRRWGKVQVKLGASSSVNKVLASVIPLIRYPTMTLHEFTTVVVPAGLLPQSTLVEIFTYFGSDESKQLRTFMSIWLNVIFERILAVLY